MYFICLNCLILLLFPSCQKNTDKIPTYIYIPSFSFTSPTEQGGNTQKITDAWLYANNEFLGAYPLPAHIPLLFENKAELHFFAGIKENGVAATPIIYPFYEKYMTTIAEKPAKTDTLTPNVRYDSGTKFSFIENFESNNIFTIDKDGNPRTNLVLAKGWNGTRSGKIYLDETNDKIEVATALAYSDFVASKSNYVFLEMDYKNDVELQVGFIGYDKSGNETVFYKIVLRAKEDWNKTYINFSSDMIAAQFTQYRIVFKANLPKENGIFTRSNADIWLDNIKLVHF